MQLKARVPERATQATQSLFPSVARCSGGGLRTSEFAGLTASQMVTGEQPPSGQMKRSVGQSNQKILGTEQEDMGTRLSPVVGTGPLGSRL